MGYGSTMSDFLSPLSLGMNDTDTAFSSGDGLLSLSTQRIEQLIEAILEILQQIAATQPSRNEQGADAGQEPAGAQGRSVGANAGNGGAQGSQGPANAASASTPASTPYSAPGSSSTAAPGGSTGGPPSEPYIDASKYVSPGNGADQTAGLQAAIDEGKRTGEPVYLKAGTYNHSGQLHLDGVKLVGDGDKTVLNATSSTNSAIALTGSDASLSHVKVEVSGAVSRSSQPQDCAVLIRNASNATVSDVTTQGASANGIRLDNAQHCAVARNLVQGSNADGIALTNGSSYNDITRNVVYQARDDGISNDRYTSDAGALQSNSIDGNVVMNSQYGSGIKDAGGTDTTIANNTIIGVPGQGVFTGVDGNSGTAVSTGVTARNNIVQHEYDETDHVHHATPGTPDDVKSAIANVDLSSVLGRNAVLTDVDRYNGSYVPGTGDGANNSGGVRT